jgi:LmbE family N-acetylglucosaminyl deacetylase
MNSLMAIFAHPDDDVTIGPLLAHHAMAGIDLSLVVVTKGELGVTGHCGVPAGDELAAIREAEVMGACEHYGVGNLVLLRERDASLAAMDRREQAILMERLREAIAQAKPSVIITFGPEGYTRHSDHRAVGAYVTELFQSWQPDAADGYVPQKLYYVGIPASKLLLARELGEPFSTAFYAVDDAFITTVVDVSDGLAAAARAESCYKSQHTAAIMDGFNEIMARVFEGKCFLRLAMSRAAGESAEEEDIFEGLW